MAVSGLAKGDKLGVYRETADDFTENERVVFVKEIEACVQLLSTKEARDYGGDGQSRFVQVLMSQDLGISTLHILRHLSKTDGSIVPQRWYRVRSTKEEGAPGRTVLWVAYAEELTNDGIPTIGS
jgi:hypothetical protein